MINVKGDPNVHVTRQMVTEAFLRVGAVWGDTVMYHGSLRCMGTVDGGVKTITDGVLDAVGPTGTVAMPSLFYDGKPETNNPDLFDVETSPTWVGALAEGFRQDPRSIRSNHWTHSVSAIGARAAELCADHGAFGPRPSPWSETAFAVSSPWQKFIDWNALYGFIGVNLVVCTLRHLIESLIVIHILEKLPEGKRLDMRNKLRHDRLPVNLPWPGFPPDRLHEQLEAEGLMATTSLGCAKLSAIRARTLVNRTLEIIESDMDNWLVPPFLAWRDECLKLM